MNRTRSFTLISLILMLEQRRRLRDQGAKLVGIDYLSIENPNHPDTQRASRCFQKVS